MGLWNHPMICDWRDSFLFVYGTEAIISAEIREETQLISEYDPGKNRTERSFDLEVIEERRDRAYVRILHHKGLMIKCYNRKVRPDHFQVGDLVLKKVEVSKYVGKLDLSWEGPFKVVEVKRWEHTNSKT
ncbi:UNVERIFIED_CONTAM: hypothetical protein Slati_0431900 [Sesamum latifolium]|uniref:Uncharacterized protein n=1 Tax=Sesamum latifolium TaxID=2727402 RepID=A0AAW2XVP0_9LAMI